MLSLLLVRCLLFTCLDVRGYHVQLVEGVLIHASQDGMRLGLSQLLQQNHVFAKLALLEFPESLDGIGHLRLAVLLEGHLEDVEDCPLRHVSGKVTTRVEAQSQ